MTRPQALFRVLLAAMLAALAVSSARADEEPPLMLQPSAVIEAPATSLPDRTSTSLDRTIESALDLIGIRYRRGGASPEKGFDCSGFVGHVFREGLGLYLPRTARELAQTGQTVPRDELQPGDLVFFNTMRRAFSHVGIYLGNNQFLHAPRTGGRVRIDEMTGYWLKRFNGARRLLQQ